MHVEKLHAVMWEKYIFHQEQNVKRLLTYLEMDSFGTLQSLFKD